MQLLKDSQWVKLKPVIIPQKNEKGGRPRETDRKMLEGCLYILCNGVPWRSLPEEFGVYTTCWRRFQRWNAEGAWPKIWKLYLLSCTLKQKAFWTRAFSDGFFTPSLP